jgi:peptidoglycan hydrolase-like protein with peptidoglycan-binding domain
MVPIHLLATVMAFAWASAVAATAAYWDQPVQDRNTVASVQQTLHAEGYDPGPVNGRLGPQTVQAVKQAQEDRELESTGRLDRRTVAALGIDAESAAAGASTDGRQDESRPGSGFKERSTLPGESSSNRPAEAEAKRCKALSGVQREQCLRELGAARGGTAPQPAPPVGRDPVTDPPPQNPR